jgi:hypothetical protein
LENGKVKRRPRQKKQHVQNPEAGQSFVKERESAFWENLR